MRRFRGRCMHARRTQIFGPVRANTNRAKRIAAPSYSGFFVAGFSAARPGSPGLALLDSPSTDRPSFDSGFPLAGSRGPASIAGGLASAFGSRPNSSVRTRSCSRSICSGVAPNSRSTATVKPSATSPSPENTSSAPAARKLCCSLTYTARASTCTSGLISRARRMISSLPASADELRMKVSARARPAPLSVSRVRGIAIDRVNAATAQTLDDLEV